MATSVERHSQEKVNIMDIHFLIIILLISKILNFRFLKIIALHIKKKEDTVHKKVLERYIA